MVTRRDAPDHAMPATFTPVFGARGDGRATATSSRALLMTVLGEFVLPHGGRAWTQSLVVAMNEIGVKEKATRQALTRMENSGWLSRERVGRQTRWSLTEDSQRLLTEGAERIYGFGRDRETWDEQWVVVLASVPETGRKLRYRMGRGLSWAGFGSLGQGVWISPWVERETVAARLLVELGVDATSFVAGLGQLGSGPDLAHTAWDVPELADEYRTFLDTTATLTHAATGRQAAVALIDLVHRWRRFPFLDPDLPAALLPADWPGPEAVERFSTARSALQQEAYEWWSTLEGGHTPKDRVSI